MLHCKVKLDFSDIINVGDSMKMMIFENKVDENNLFENEMDNRNSVMLSFFLEKLKTKKVVVDRFKLNKNPEIFEQQGIVQKIDDGMKLPITVVDGKVVLSGRYPKSYEILDFLHIDRSIFNQAYVNDKRKF